MTRILLLSTLLLAACGDKDDTDTAATTEEADSDTDTDADTDTDTDTDADANMEPMTCEQDTDCEGVCPEGSMGCVCSETPDGDKVCAPTCDTDEDCVMDDMICEQEEGVCVPSGGPMQ